MFINLYNRKFAVFLAAVSDDMKETRQELEYVLVNAGIKIVDGQNLSLEKVADAMRDADCSVHILGKTDIYTPGSDGCGIPAGVQFRRAKEKCSEEFKMFVWNPRTAADESRYVNSIRRDIVENIVYSDRPSPIVFTEDIRNIMNVRQTESRRHEPTDIFFLHNELDSDTASDIYNMLRDFVGVRKLGISMSSDVDYNTYISEQLADSKVGVIYYNYAGDWAVSFARQVWKDSGGSSSRVPLAVIGNSDHATTDELSVLNEFMECSVDDQRRIPLDIKVFLDKNYQK
jgi:hypothetical protein